MIISHKKDQNKMEMERIDEITINATIRDNKIMIDIISKKLKSIEDKNNLYNVKTLISEIAEGKIQKEFIKELHNLYYNTGKAWRKNK